MKMFSLAVIIAAAAGMKLAISKSPQVVPGQSSMWTLETDGTAPANWTFVSGIEGYEPSPSGSAVCDNLYVAVYADASTGKYGLFSYDLSTKKHTDYATVSLFHKIVCDPKNKGTILGAASDFTSVQNGRLTAAGGAPFHLKRFTLASAKEDVVGDFPTTNNWGGYDNIFEFNEDATELWAGIPNDEGFDKSGGYLQIINVATGNITTNAAFPDGIEGKGFPWHLTPGPIDGPISAAMHIAGSGTSQEINTAVLTIKKNKVEVKKTGKFEPGFSAAGPWQRCGKNFLMLNSEGRSPSKVFVFDAQTMKVTTTIDLTGFPGKDPSYILGGVACMDSTLAATSGTTDIKTKSSGATCSAIGDCGRTYQGCCAGFAAKGFPCDCHLQDGTGTAGANCGTCGTGFAACCVGFAAKGFPCKCNVA